LAYLYGAPQIGALQNILRTCVPVEREYLDRLERVAVFGAYVLNDHRNDGYPGDIDGGDAQDRAIEYGLLHTVRFESGCGAENCVCAEGGEPPYDCLRCAPGIGELMDALLAARMREKEQR
jgi:hypothetical protein